MFMNGWYGYDVQCEIVAEGASVRLPDPANIIWRKDGMCGYEVCSSWKDRFLDAYEVEIKEWVNSVRAGKPRGASAWDGYMASLTGELATKSRLEGGTVVPFPDMAKPAFYQ
jgi:myo-inositol 2-dehydrogenase/D-chiro-inositol 1-dehydrogenase